MDGSSWRQFSPYRDPVPAKSGPDATELAAIFDTYRFHELFQAIIMRYI